MSTEPISSRTYKKRVELKNQILEKLDEIIYISTNEYSATFNTSINDIDIYTALETVVRSGHTDLKDDSFKSSNEIILDKKMLNISNIKFTNNLYTAFADNSVEIFCNSDLLKFFASIFINDVNSISSINSVTLKNNSIVYTVDKTDDYADLFKDNKNIYTILGDINYKNKTITDIMSSIYKNVNVNSNNYYNIGIEYTSINDEVLYSIIIQYILTLYSLKSKYSINLNSIGIDDLVFKPINRDIDFYEKNNMNSDNRQKEFTNIRNNATLLTSSNRFIIDNDYIHGKGYLYYSIGDRYYKTPNYGFMVYLKSVGSSKEYVNGMLSFSTNDYLSDISTFKINYKNKIYHFKRAEIFYNQYSYGNYFNNSIKALYDKIPSLNITQKTFYLGTEYTADTYLDLLQKIISSTEVNYSWDLGYFMNSIRLTPKYNLFSHELYTYYEDISRLLLVRAFGNSQEWTEKNRVIQASLSALLDLASSKKILSIPKVSYLVQIDEFIDYLSIYSNHSGSIAYRVFMNFIANPINISKELLDIKKSRRNKKTLKLKTELADDFNDSLKTKLDRGFIVDFYKNPQTTCPSELDLLPDTPEEAKKSPYRIAGGAQGQIYDVNVYEDEYSIDDVYNIVADDETNINGYIVQILPHLEDNKLRYIFIRIENEMYNVDIANISTHIAKYLSEDKNTEIIVHILEPHKLNTKFFTKRDGSIKVNIKYIDKTKNEDKFINLALKKFPPIYADKYETLNCDIINNNIVQCNETTNEMLIAYLLNIYYNDGRMLHFLQYYKLMSCSATVKNSDIAKFRKLKKILSDKKINLSQFKLDDKFNINDYQKINYYCLMEKIDGDLYSFHSIVDKLQYISFVSCGRKTSQYYTKQQYINNCLMQVFYSLYFFQKELKGMHNDLHPGNIFIKLCDDTIFRDSDGKETKLIDIKYFTYKFSETLVFRVPNIGFIIKLGDPGHASIQVKIEGKDVIFRKNTELNKHSIMKTIGENKQVGNLIEYMPVFGRFLKGVAVSSYERNSINRLYNETLDLANLMNSLASHPYFFDNLLVREYIETEKLIYYKKYNSLDGFNSKGSEFSISKRYTPELINTPSLYYPVLERYTTPKLILANPYLSYYTGVFNTENLKFKYNMDYIEETIFNQSNMLRLCIINNNDKKLGLDGLNISDNGEKCSIDNRNDIQYLTKTNSVNQYFEEYMDKCLNKQKRKNK